MNKQITFNNDFTNAYVSKAFQKKAMLYGTPEYTMLRDLCTENPNVQICVRKTGSSANYNLTYAHMEAYIADKPNAEALLAEFNRIKKESVVQRNRHLYVVKWFKAVFPNYTEAELFQKKPISMVDLITGSTETADNEAEVA